MCKREEKKMAKIYLNSVAVDTHDNGLCLIKFLQWKLPPTTHCESWDPSIVRVWLGYYKESYH